MGILRDLFGPGTWGTGGNMVAWILCGALGGAWLHGKEQARHLARLKQADEHHAEAMALAREHHEAMITHVTEQSGGGSG